MADSCSSGSCGTGGCSCGGHSASGRRSNLPVISVDRSGIHDQNLTELAQKMSNYCIKNFKLDYPDIRFHVVPLDHLSRIIAAHGYPVHPDSWELQQTYELQKRGHEWGNWIIYEIVAGSGVRSECGKTKEPIEAFIYDADSITDMKLVIAHVFGHSQGFTSSSFFNLNKPESPCGMMIEQERKYDDYYEYYGLEKVIECLDAINAVSTLVPIYPDFNQRLDIAFADPRNFQIAPHQNVWTTMMHGDRKLKMTEMMLKARGQETMMPGRTITDIFRILKQSPELEPWQKDLVKMEHERQGFLRKYGSLQKLHEGIASFVDLRFGVEATEFISDEEVFRYLRSRTNGFAHPQYGVNPYGLGFNLLYHIAKKWDDGRFGVEYDLCENAHIRRDWNTGHGKGWEKVLEVVRDCTDYDFLQLYFDEEFFNTYGNQFLVYQDQHYSSWWWDVIDYVALSREYTNVKNAFLFQACNAGLPFFNVPPGGANYKNNGELIINHDISGIPELFNVEKESLTLEPNDLEGVLRGLFYLWKKPVHIKTINGYGDDILISYDGKKFSEKPIAEINDI